MAFYKWKSKLMYNVTFFKCRFNSYNITFPSVYISFLKTYQGPKNEDEIDVI